MDSNKFPQIGILARPVKHQVSSTGALERTLNRAGYRTRASYDLTAPEPIIICWGWGKAKECRQKNPEAVILCLDHGYTWQRKQFVNTGWSVPSERFGLNGFAEHVVKAIREEIRKVERGEWPADGNPVKRAPHTQADVIGEWHRAYGREEAVFPLRWVAENKFWPSVNRIDDVYGDRNLVCGCSPA